MKERESNIEAARILAMILVVLIHANYFSLGGIGSGGKPCVLRIDFL